MGALDMATKKATKPEIVEIDEQPVEEIEVADSEGDAEDDGESFGMYDPMEQLSQLLVTEDGTPLIDVIVGVRDALDKQNKIMFRLLGVLEERLGK